MPGWVPAYRRMLSDGQLAARAAAPERTLERCAVCPCRCGVDRRYALGRCVTPAAPVIASHGAHFGEEPPISGRRGSGTVFLANCNLRCVFCQNHDISQRPKEFVHGATTVGELAAIMLELQDLGCHNINWVSPTHQVPALVRALELAARHGLALPVVYNTNAYDAVEVLRLLDGVVDIYLPDLKYASEAAARQHSRVRDYPAVARAALAEMYRQVGAGWDTDRDGVLRHGLLVRILVLPHDLAGVGESLRWIAAELSPAVAVSLMSQYRPAHLATRPGRYPPLARGVSPSEYSEALRALERWNASQDTFAQPYLGRP